MGQAGRGDVTCGMDASWVSLLTRMAASAKEKGKQTKADKKTKEDKKRKKAEKKEKGAKKAKQEIAAPSLPSTPAPQKKGLDAPAIAVTPMENVKRSVRCPAACVIASGCALLCGYAAV